MSACWSKDTVSESPKVVYTPTSGNPGLSRIVYDPNAPSDKRLTAEFSYLTGIGESIEDLDAAMGL